MTAPPKEIQILGRLLAYVLGKHPDEFGLVPDARGFIPMKELLKALHEEEGWRHLRITHLHQLVAMHRPAPVEIEERLIRATSRDQLPEIRPPRHLPKSLFIAVRRRAHIAALANGLHAGNRPHLILAADRTMALRLGRRLDREAVMLTVQVAQSQRQGTTYRQYGDALFLADTIAADTLTGPAPPKAKEAPASKVSQTPPTPPLAAGSYFPEWGPSSEEKKALKRERRVQKTAKERARRQARREKKRTFHSS